MHCRTSSLSSGRSTPRVLICRPYAEHLCSWGFSVLQYNAPPWKIVKDSIELQFLPAILDWLRANDDGAPQHAPADAGPPGAHIAPDGTRGASATSALTRSAQCAAPHLPGSPLGAVDRESTAIPSPHAARDAPGAGGAIDWGRVAVAGHSRGGKLAGLLFAHSDAFKVRVLSSGDRYRKRHGGG